MKLKDCIAPSLVLPILMKVDEHQHQWRNGLSVDLKYNHFNPFHFCNKQYNSRVIK